MTPPTDRARRRLLQASLQGAAVGLLAAVAGVPRSRAAADGAQGGQQRDASVALAELERRAGGRLGVCALDTGNGRTLHWRGDERFAMCSTFKLPLAAVVLAAIEQGEFSATETIAFSRDDLVPHAPVINARLEAGVHALTLADLAQATQQTSDNVAANLLVTRLGGPAAVTARWRALGDAITRLDRMEPELNVLAPGEDLDTTTPRAMARLVATCVAGDALTMASRDRLATWLVDTQTGLRRLRAGLPPGWRSGDKTGTALVEGAPARINDVAVAWPSASSAPWVIAAYCESAHRDGRMRPEDEAVLADAARVVVAAWHDGAA